MFNSSIVPRPVKYPAPYAGFVVGVSYANLRLVYE